MIKGAALNNDGSSKVSFTAPSVDGQAEAIALAQALAGIDPDTIGYVEAHGTGTALGDPIEVAALTQAFRRQTAARGFCALGSLKTNIGHLDAAAGVAGLIKATLALHHEAIPPSLHFESPNPKLGLEESPFYVNTTCGPGRRAGLRAGPASARSAWAARTRTSCSRRRRRARPCRAGRAEQLLALSARSAPALDAATANLARHLEEHPEADLADVAFTLQAGRRALRPPPRAGRPRRRATRSRAPAPASIRKRVAPSRPAGRTVGRAAVPGPGRAVRGHGPAASTRRSRRSAPRSTPARRCCAGSWASTSAAVLYPAPRRRRRRRASARPDRPHPARAVRRRIRAGVLLARPGAWSRRR